MRQRQDVLNMSILYMADITLICFLRGSFWPCVQGREVIITDAREKNVHKDNVTICDPAGEEINEVRISTAVVLQIQCHPARIAHARPRQL